MARVLPQIGQQGPNAAWGLIVPVLKAVVALLLALFSLPGFVVWLTFRRFSFPRWDWVWPIVVASVVVASQPQIVTSYIQYLGRTARFEFSLLTNAEFVGLISIALFVAGVLGLIGGPALGKLIAPVEEVTDSILPYALEKSLRKSIAIWLIGEKLEAVQMREARKLADEDEPHGVFLGYDVAKNPIVLEEQQLKTNHIVVTGMSGAGKTVTLTTLIGGVADLGHDITILDLKGALEPGSMRAFAKEYAKLHNIPYRELHLDTQHPCGMYFDPLAGLDEASALDAIFSTLVFDDQFFQSQAKKAIAQVTKLYFRCYEDAPERFSTPTLYEIGLAMQQIGSKGGGVKERLAFVKMTTHLSELVKELDAITDIKDDLRKQCESTGLRLTNLFEDKVGRGMLTPGSFVDEHGSIQEKISLDLEESGITYIGLSVLSVAELSLAVSTLVLKRLGIYAGLRAGGLVAKSKHRFIFVDEAAQLNRRVAQDILEQARSANMSLVLATQGPNQWNTGRTQDWSTILNNCRMYICMRLGSREEGTLAAEAIGKHRINIQTNRLEAGEIMTDVGSSRISEEYWVSPDDVTSLGTGAAIVRYADAGSKPYWVQIDRRLT